MNLQSFAVQVNLTIDAQGVPHDIQVAGDPNAKAAKQAAGIVAKWRFTPGLRDGQPIAIPATFLMVHGLYASGGRITIK
jgi:hypothetical protein